MNKNRIHLASAKNRASTSATHFLRAVHNLILAVHGCFQSLVSDLRGRVARALTNVTDAPLVAVAQKLATKTLFLSYRFG